MTGGVPHLADPNVNGNNVFSRVKSEEFKRFYELAEEHAKLIRRAQAQTDPNKALAMWQRVFGDCFRKPGARAGRLLRDASMAASAAGGITFPSQAAVPPNKLAGFA